MQDESKGEALYKGWSQSAWGCSRQSLSVASPSPGSVAGQSRLLSDVVLLLAEVNPGPRQLDRAPGTLGICLSWDVCSLSRFMLPQLVEGPLVQKSKILCGYLLHLKCF